MQMQFTYLIHQGGWYCNRLDIDADGCDRAEIHASFVWIAGCEHADIILPNITGSRIYLDNGTLIFTSVSTLMSHHVLC